MKTLVLAVFAGLSAGVFAAPTVTDVTLAQGTTRNVVVEYSLSEKAIVTVQFLTNGVPLAPASLTGMIGDVNRVVPAGTGRVLWRPDRALVADWEATAVARVIAWSLDDPPDYLAIDLANPKDHRYYASAEEVPQGVSNEIYKTTSMLFRKIPAKNVSWRMGGGTEVGTYKQNIADYRNSEKYHTVTLDHNYYMALYEMTADQYSMLANGTRASANGTHPAVNCSYNYLRGAAPDIDYPDTGSSVAANSFMQTIRNKTGIPSMDLPTEAEWEFACRAGTATAFNNGKNLADFSDPIPDGIGWCSSSSPKPGSRQIIGQLTPNNWFLYDMHGNVAELCLDWYSERFYPEGSEWTNPTGPKASEVSGLTTRVTRGGSWILGTASCRSACRAGLPWNPSSTQYGWVGFRLSCGTRAE